MSHKSELTVAEFANEALDLVDGITEAFELLEDLDDLPRRLKAFGLEARGKEALKSSMDLRSALFTGSVMTHLMRPFHLEQVRLTKEQSRRLTLLVKVTALTNTSTDEEMATPAYQALLEEYHTLLDALENERGN